MQAKKELQRYERAQSRRNIWLSEWEDCYDYGFPGRDTFYGGATPGESRTEELYDDTAVNAIQDFGSVLTEGLFGGDFALMKAGPSVPKEQQPRLNKELQEVNTIVLDIVRNSNFYEQANEVAMDLSIGTGNLIVEPSGDGYVINNRAVPLHEVTLERGPNGMVDATFRNREMSVNDVKVLWPKARIPDSLSSSSERHEEIKVRVLEVCRRNWDNPNDERYDYGVMELGSKEMMFTKEYRGLGSKPWINSRWSTASGETYGRGPLLNSLNSVRGLNLIKKLNYENADMAIGGVWTIENDGTINPDTITIESGTVIPHAPGTKGLQGVQSPSNFDLSNFVIADEKRAIRQALFVEDYDGQGKTPISAEEVESRRALLARRMGSPFIRLYNELVLPYLRRVVFIAKEEGLIELPRLDGREVQVITDSPLARAARMEEAQRKVMYVQAMGGIYGPEMAMQRLELDRIAADVTKLMGQPEGYIKEGGSAEQEKAMQMLTNQMAVAGGQAG